jgi:hypothetical protein
VQPPRRRLPSYCSGEEEGATQQPIADGSQHGTPVGLSLLEGARRFQPGQLLSVRLGLGQPGGGGGGEGGVTSSSMTSLNPAARSSRWWPLRMAAALGPARRARRRAAGDSPDDSTMV